MSRVKQNQNAIKCPECNSTKIEISIATEMSTAKAIQDDSGLKRIMYSKPEFAKQYAPACDCLDCGHQWDLYDGVPWKLIHEYDERERRKIPKG